ncbi:hypothetical protein MtrunA17_Chr7g0242181 [Medicago truncatula]|uniref:DUF247 domain protein n=1 Tax=Medicago truncatula TaxID=3880 RepID=G7KRF9_MEDTR|nr:UPF0481 protein At3g47200 [Medicago truncatula]AES79501.1 DUF247 domain protein [Medicago truncatula]RHN46437.1 hypothetical protein MtrunA17_Chr7g0242181 [Medicago truncatula]
MASTKKTENDTEMMNDWLNSIQTLLKSVDHDYIQSCSISIVPEELKNSLNEEAYMPRVVSIGPRFKGSREDLLLMEEVKLRSMLSLLHRAGKEGESKTYLEKCSKAIWELDKLVRASYVSDIKLEKHELAKIMLVDGCFLLELVITKGFGSELPSRLNSHCPAPEVLKDEDVLSDLMLLENQIPILVLHKLSQILFPNVFDSTDRVQRATKINNLILSILSYPEVSNLSNLEAPHILDLVHFFVNSRRQSESESDSEIESNDNHIVGITEKNQKLKLELKRCASRLLAAGVSIKVIEDDKDSRISSCFSLIRNFFGGVFIKFGKMLVVSKEIDKQVDATVVDGEVRGLDFEFKFENGKFEIAQLHITKTTKAKWCNVIAWEHHKKNWKSSSMDGYESGDENQIGTINLSGKFTLSALIFNGLICCEADVKLLKEKNIIVDHLKMNNEELQDFFRTISFGVDREIVDSSYVKMVDELNNYSEAFFILKIFKIFRHLCMYHLEWVVNFLKQNYNFVAALVALLSVVQTVYAILDYYLKK